MWFVHYFDVRWFVNVCAQKLIDKYFIVLPRDDVSQADADCARLCAGRDGAALQRFLQASSPAELLRLSPAIINSIPQAQDYKVAATALAALPEEKQKQPFRELLARAVTAAGVEDGFLRALLQHGHAKNYYDLSLDTDEISRLAEAAAAAGRAPHVSLLLSYDCDRASADVRAKLVRVCCAAAAHGHAALLAQVLVAEKVGVAGEALVLAAYAHAAKEGAGALEPLRVLHARGADVTPAAKRAEADEKVALQRSIKAIKVRARGRGC